MRPLPTIERISAGPFSLRPWTMDDVPVVQEAGSDPYIVAVTTVPDSGSADDAADFIRRQWKRRADGTGYSFAIKDSADVAVGQIGLWLRHVDAGRAELGYWTAPSARRRGVAGHALRALADWAETQLHIPRLHLFVEPSNAASIATAERCGFLREGLLRSWQEIAGTRRDMYVYARVR